LLFLREGRHFLEREIGREEKKGGEGGDIEVVAAEFSLFPRIRKSRGGTYVFCFMLSVFYC